MNKKLYAGISQILLGALVAIAPQTFAHVCAVKECRWHAITRLRLRSASVL